MVQFILALVATLPFAILFNAPRRLYLVCAVGGGIGWTVYLGVLNSSQIPALSYFVATLVLMLYGRLAGVVLEAPVIIFVITGIFALVPGAAIYYTAYYLFGGDVQLAGAKAIETLIAAGSIALGMLFGYALPQKMFTLAGRGVSRLLGKTRTKDSF